MKIKMTIATEHRKAFANILAKKIGAEAKYAGVPSCAYTVGEVSFEKDLTVTAPSQEAMQPLLEILNEEGVHYEVIEADEPAEPKTEEEDPEEDTLTVEMPRDLFTNETLENLKRIIDSKRTLMQHAFKTEDLSVRATDDTISFPWFTLAEPREMKAYTEFVAAICEMARKQKRISAKQKEYENEKYAFRCFLLRLGFIGADYKETRTVLLKNLEGSAAFPTKQAADEFAAKQKAERDAKKGVEA